MSERIDIPRCPVPDERISQKGDIGPLEKTFDECTNPSGHDIYEASPCDPDSKAQYIVPDCSYKGYDAFTWPEGKASPLDLPCHNMEHQSDETEDIKPYKR